MAFRYNSMAKNCLRNDPNNFLLIEAIKSKMEERKIN